jgi:tRNA (guanine-N7-)-methyltransferase
MEEAESHVVKEDDVKAAIPALPQKKFYRQRAHANPMSDHDIVYPRRPEE